MTIFKTPAQLHKWLEKNHDKASELWVGMHNRRSDKRSITYKEALDEALCFGWIDGVRKSVNKGTYVQRFTLRKKSSKWSRINIKRVEELIASGRMTSVGLLQTFKMRKQQAAGYSYEKRPQGLDPAAEGQRLNLRSRGRAFVRDRCCHSHTVCPTVSGRVRDVCRISQIHCRHVP